jgi:hypothetical protein
MLLKEGSFDTAPLAPPLSGPFRAISGAHSQPVAWLASYCATQPSKTNLIDALLLFGLRSCSETWEKASGKLPSFLDVIQLEWKPVFRRLVPESSTLLLLLGTSDRLCCPVWASTTLPTMNCGLHQVCKPSFHLTALYITPARFP